MRWGDAGLLQAAHTKLQQKKYLCENENIAVVVAWLRRSGTA